MIKSYQHLALDIPEDTEYEPILCIVKLIGLTIGDIEAHGQVTAYMGYDESGDYFVPMDVVDSRLVTNSEEEALNLDNDTVYDAMLAAYERFENYFERTEVREV
ncbi:hypothetical protein [Dyadobacter bucti]|uniref:hypothetical protein n=1 Tax=Dyadobacter bucti TaxID=2572203 RepID=UPI001107C0EA|nr:hypothetical protein [Dyadobacter bucti]